MILKKWKFYLSNKKSPMETHWCGYSSPYLKVWEMLLAQKHILLFGGYFLKILVCLTKTLQLSRNMQVPQCRPTNIRNMNKFMLSAGVLKQSWDPSIDWRTTGWIPGLVFQTLTGHSSFSACALM